jgi:FkbM family methyltransferase
MNFDNLYRLAAAAVDQIDNWPEVFAACCNEARGRYSSEQALRLRMRNGIDLEIMPGGLGGFYHLFREIYVQKVYEPAEFNLGSSPTIVDVGANVGFFTCKIAKQRPDARVIAIEAMPQYVALLAKNVANSQLSNVEIVHTALSDQSSCPIEHWFEPNGYLKVCRPPAGVASQVLHVKGQSLEQLFADLAVQECDLLKVDIEGHEYSSLMTASPAVLARIKHIALEWHRTHVEHKPAELVEFLGDHGFDILKRSDLGFRRSTGMLYATRVGTSLHDVPTRGTISRPPQEPVNGDSVDGTGRQVSL